LFHVEIVKKAKQTRIDSFGEFFISFYSICFHGMFTVYFLNKTIKKVNKNQLKESEFILQGG
jgi:hypothetical protein